MRDHAAEQQRAHEQPRADDRDRERERPEVPRHPRQRTLEVRARRVDGDVLGPLETDDRAPVAVQCCRRGPERPHREPASTTQRRGGGRQRVPGQAPHEREHEPPQRDRDDTGHERQPRSRAPSCATSPREVAVVAAAVAVDDRRARAPCRARSRDERDDRRQERPAAFRRSTAQPRDARRSAGTPIRKTTASMRVASSAPRNRPATSASRQRGSTRGDDEQPQRGEQQDLRRDLRVRVARERDLREDEREREHRRQREQRAAQQPPRQDEEREQRDAAEQLRACGTARRHPRSHTPRRARPAAGARTGTATFRRASA